MQSAVWYQFLATFHSIPFSWNSLLKEERRKAYYRAIEIFLEK